MPVNFVAKFAITAAMAAAQMALTMSRKIEGPRLDSTDVTTADYGTPIPRFWGKRRFEGVPIIWAEKLREKKVTSKTKGGKYSQYKYYGTWAVLITDTEIDAVSRLWFDKHLVYDLTRASPISPGSLFEGSLEGSPIKLRQGRNIRIYLGTEDQMPDPRIETWCEARYGPDSCPAYRGSAYIVFENIPLEKFGNRIPQISVEAVRVKTSAYPFEVSPGVIDAVSSYVFARSPTGEWLVRYVGDTIEWWDPLTRKLLGSVADAPANYAGAVDNRAVSADGTIYYWDAVTSGPDAGPKLVIQQPLGGRTLLAGDVDDLINTPTRVFETATFPRVLAGTTTAGYVSFTSQVRGGPAGRDFCQDGDGKVWGLFHPLNPSADFMIRSMDTAPVVHTVTGLVTRSGPTKARICHVSAYNHFFVVTDGRFYTIDDTTFAIKTQGVAPWGSADVLPTNNPECTTFWHIYNEYSLEDGALVRVESGSRWAVGAAAITSYDPLTHAILDATGTSLVWRYLDRVAAAAVTVGTIVQEVSEWAGVDDADTSLCTQLIKGYSVTQGPAKDMIAPLLDAYDVDAHPHDFVVKFTPRGAAPVLSIDVSEFAREGDSPRYVMARAQDTDLPLHINFNYADETKDQQTNTAVAKRASSSTDSKRELSIDLTTLVLQPNEAQPLVERFMRRRWNERDGVTLGLTAQQLALEPSEVVTLHLDNVSWNARLTRMVVKRSSIETEWTRDAVALATLPNTAGATMDGRDDEVIYIPGPAKGFVLDVPLVRDADNDINPLLYFAAGGYSGTSFPGADVWRGDDGTYDEQWGAIEGDQAATWGYVSEALPDCIPWLWDRGSVLTLDLVSGGTLNTVTEAQVNADPTLNLVAIGAPGRYEFVQFTTATLVSGNTWTLSGFKRGRRGTEVNCGNHQAGDEVLFLNQARHVEMGAGDLGDALSFKVAATGRSVDASPAIDVTYSGATLKPRPPVIAWKVKESNGDITIHLRSRTRIGGNWNGSTIPTGETIESYEYVLANGRVLTSSTKTLTYTQAQQLADGGDVLPQDLNGTAYQLSATVGRGFAAAA